MNYLPKNWVLSVLAGYVLSGGFIQLALAETQAASAASAPVPQEETVLHFERLVERVFQVRQWKVLD